ncbi:MAG: radical SAM protein [Clostridia bacterium]|nr:radical SAM protein [Clostridia bacterium]
MNKPAYLDLLDNNELEKRVNILKQMLKNCVLCPHQCGVDRLNDEKGYCKTLDHCVVSGAEAHFGEEKELVGVHGSGTIFFSYCNLECVFCQNYEISHCGEGQTVSSYQLSDLMLSLQSKGCHNINLVSPSHIVPQIVEAVFLAAEKGLQIPIIYNTNGYDLVDTLKLLDGIVDIYMPDLKFSDDPTAFQYLKVKNYSTIAQNAIKEMHRQVNDLQTDDRNIAYRGLLIRHLVMPQNIAGSEKIMTFIANEISKDTYVNIMAQYYPAYNAFQFHELSRQISDKEYKMAVDSARSAGLKRYQSSI